MDEMIKVIVCQLDNQTYGVDVQHVLSIEEMTSLTPVPKASEFIKGILYLRGDMIPVIDLKERLEIRGQKNASTQRIVIVMLDDVQAGFIVDAATDVIDIETSTIEEAPELLGSIDKTFIQGVAKRENDILILLDLVKVLNFEETNEVKQLEEDLSEAQETN
ncbi:Chemotaxis protein CheW [Lentibacillus sp. JNUCC-1]|uniref:chemotaxis protein CheW n=1 Tax=Lentibacillus sp. JNUCC-1 TaxID=2654513 RepID=UPI0012E8822B|nr:chemotaxis protein CheW [Lentibacillus sp. JNUCC-1]MUV38629.1 Chemotaxis protein CheW [Lentibacillus sp. JNUCC-1]